MQIIALFFPIYRATTDALALINNQHSVTDRSYQGQLKSTQRKCARVFYQKWTINNIGCQSTVCHRFQILTLLTKYGHFLFKICHLLALNMKTISTAIRISFRKTTMYRTERLRLVSLKESKGHGYTRR